MSCKLFSCLSTVVEINWLIDSHQLFSKPDSKPYLSQHFVLVAKVTEELLQGLIMSKEDM